MAFLDESGVITEMTRRYGRPVWPFVIFSDDHPLGEETRREVDRQALSGSATCLSAFSFTKAHAST